MYDLGYVQDDGENIFVPVLLPTDRLPKDRIPGFQSGKDLILKYNSFDHSLPSNTVARLIVRQHDKIRKSEVEGKSIEDVWRHGAVFTDKDKKTIAFVEEKLVYGEYTKSVNLSVKGENKTSFFAELRTVLNEIFESYTSADPELTYTVIEPEDRINHIEKINDDISGLNRISFIEQKNRINHIEKCNDDISGLHGISSGENKAVELAEKIIKDFLGRDRPYVSGDRDIDLKPTGTIYNIVYVENFTEEHASINVKDSKAGVINLGDGSTISQTNTINIHNYANELQGQLHTLADDMSKNPEYEDDVQELRNVIGDMDKAKPFMPTGDLATGETADQETKDSIISKGILNRLKMILKDLEDEDSTLYKNIKKVKRGVGIAQDIAEKYNGIAQWLGLPQVPKPFLKK
jgi:uncharacterized protein with HEPN domain